MLHNRKQNMTLCNANIWFVKNPFLFCLLFLFLVFTRANSVGTSHRGLQAAYRLGKALVAGRSTQRELDRNFYRKWATSQAKAWGKMLKVGTTENIVILKIFTNTV